MGLFKSLLDSNAGQVGENETEKPTTASSLSIPTVVLLYKDKPLEFQGVITPSFAPLTFQAIPTAVEEPASPANVGLRAKKTTEVVPDLGVWNCRVTKSLCDALISIPAKSVSMFCWKVDMSDAASVEPTVTALQEALVRFLIQTSEDHQEDSSPTATTSLYQLRSVQFGLAANDNDNSKSVAAPDETDRGVKISLQIVAVWPNAEREQSDEDTFMQQQTSALLYYHLRRFASALGASLVFLGNPDNELQPCLSLSQVGCVWKAWAQGESIWDPTMWPHLLDWKTPAEEESKVQNAPVYGAGTHNKEWIESVLLRNASYPGHWDATKESLWKILSPQQNPTESAKSAVTVSVGDEQWLQELRDSVAVPVEVAATPSKPATAPTESKTPDVSDYFASLLKT